MFRFFYGNINFEENEWKVVLPLGESHGVVFYQSVLHTVLPSYILNLLVKIWV
jgi:hypothetical protein